MAAEFPHLKLVEIKRGRARLQGGGKVPNEVKNNKRHRRQHAASIRKKLADVTVYWQRVHLERARNQLPPIANGIPFLLRLPEREESLLLRLEKDFGVTVVAQFEQGFLMVAAQDFSLADFQRLTTEFENEMHGSASIASILEIYDDGNSDERLNRILSQEFQAIWPLIDANVYILDVGIQTAGLGADISYRPIQGKNEGQNAFALRMQAWEREWQSIQVRWDDMQIEAEEELQRFLAPYGGQIIGQVGNSPTIEGGIVALPDGFSARIRMHGQGFTDLIKNYPHLFEVGLPDDIEQPDPIAGSGRVGNYIPVSRPPENAPSVCVIDSGIQEGHRLLQSAIDATASRSFLVDADIADRVEPHGHGTPVAGAILYREFPLANSAIEACCWIQNAKLLNDQKVIPLEIHPPLALQEIVTHYRNGSRNTRIFNHSIASNVPCRLTRMSTWGAVIDQLSHELDVLVIQAAGNIKGRTNSSQCPGVIESFSSGRPYPNYLRESSSRISNPAQSIQAITVGAIGLATINDGSRATIAGDSRPSAFSRSGWGLWGTIKPEVVEIGGDYLIDTDHVNLSTADEACPELVRSTFATAGAATTRALAGTSFAAPRVAAIAAALQRILPDQPTLLYRALIVQSARWPSWMDGLPGAEQVEWMRSIGYGVPDLSRATENTDRRVTLVTRGVQSIHALEAAIYTVEIPAELRTPGNDFDVRIEVTLSYSSTPRRTRSSRAGYQEVWLDWIASKKSESLEDFKARAIKGIGQAEDSDSASWMLHQRKDWGILRGVHRQAGTVQKDWVILKAFELPETFAIAVRGHNGWSKNLNSTARFALAVTIDAERSPMPIYSRIEQGQSVRLQEVELESRVKEAISEIIS